MNRNRPVLIGIFILIFAATSLAETGREGWLRYALLEDATRAKYDSLPASTVVVGDSVVLHAAQQELIRGLRGILGRTLREEKTLPREKAIILGTLASL